MNKSEEIQTSETRLQRAIEQVQVAQASTKSTLALCDDLSLLNERLRNELVRLAAERDEISQHRDALAEADSLIRHCLLGELEAPTDNVEELDTLNIMAAFLRNREEQFGQIHAELDAERQQKDALEEKVRAFEKNEQASADTKNNRDLSAISTEELFEELERRSSTRTLNKKGKK